MINSKTISADFDSHSSQLPEHELFIQIINRAIGDASAKADSADAKLLAWEAMDFLFTDRVNPFLEFIGVDPEVFKESLAEFAKPKTGTNILKTDSARRNFGISYNLFHGKPFNFHGKNLVLESDCI